jgi:hypothetical protein
MILKVILANVAESETDETNRQRSHELLRRTANLLNEGGGLHIKGIALRGSSANLFRRHAS